MKSSIFEQEGKAFLEMNKAKEGVVETPSGLQYKVIKSGAEGGKSPKVNTPCLCHYKGKYSAVLYCSTFQLPSLRVL